MTRACALYGKFYAALKAAQNDGLHSEHQDCEQEILALFGRVEQLQVDLERIKTMVLMTPQKK